MDQVVLEHVILQGIYRYTEVLPPDELATAAMTQMPLMPLLAAKPLLSVHGIISTHIPVVVQILHRIRAEFEAVLA